MKSLKSTVNYTPTDAGEAILRVLHSYQPLKPRGISRQIKAMFGISLRDDTLYHALGQLVKMNLIARVSPRTYATIRWSVKHKEELARDAELERLKAARRSKEWDDVFG